MRRRNKFEMSVEIMLLISFFIICQGWFVLAQCPTPCVCMAKNVSCTGNVKNAIHDIAFLRILQELPNGTEELFIKSGQVANLSKELFTGVSGQVNALKQFTLTSSSVSKIDKGAFEQFIHLENLDLSNNQIQPEDYIFQELKHLKVLNLKSALNLSGNRTLPEKILHQNDQLEHLDLSENGMKAVPLFNEFCGHLKLLDLSDNHLVHLKNFTFKACVELTSLIMNNSNIEKLDYDVFHGLSELRQLALGGNKLKLLHKNVVEPIPNATIGLADNPWTCNCDFIFLTEWLKEGKRTLDIICRFPAKLSGRVLQTLSVLELGCEHPKVTHVSKNPLTIFEGENGTYVVDAIGLPFVDISCNHNSKLSNQKLRVSYKHSIHLDEGDQHHYTSIRIDFINAKLADAGNISCTVKNIIGVDKLNFVLNVREKDDGQRIDIVIFVSGIMLFIITISLLIACLNIRNKKQADKEAKLKKALELKGKQNEAFEDNLKSKYRRKDSIGYFPTSGQAKTVTNA